MLSWGSLYDFLEGAGAVMPGVRLVLERVVTDIRVTEL